MSFEKNFCPSPWLHMRIDNAGRYEYCRWSTKKESGKHSGIQKETPITWFQHSIKDIRMQMLQGNEIPGCQDCRLMEKYNKISGRQKQLLKIGVTVDDFEKTFLSSSWVAEFKKTYKQQGVTDQYPQDWQIDLGNFCNSACVFCSPRFSSKLAVEFKKIGLIDALPPNSWCDDQASLSKFIEILKETPNLTYLHFIGGETLITPAFRTILQALVDSKTMSNVIIGFTTNLTVWNQEIVDLLCQFKEVNLGASIECVHPLNDYVRYGSKIDQVMQTLKRWQEVSVQHQWLMQLRTTPTVLSIWHLDTIYDYAIKNNIAVESCNFLDNPSFMRLSVLPREYRQRVIEKLTHWVNQFDVDHQSSTVVNIRNPNFASSQVLQDAYSYINYLNSQTDESHRLPDLVAYLKLLEKNRQNCVLDYLPEYEELLRSAGY